MTDFSDFPRAVKVDDTIYLGARTAKDVSGGIEAQTADVFEALIGGIEAAGAGMKDLINLRTYYVYGGAGGRDVTDYWERMTAVRVCYLAAPGPAATALRVSGAPGPDQLIGIDGVATTNPDRQRIMPDHAWDWSMPVTFSQGWRVGDTIFVGGQISADRSGKALAPGDWKTQTRNTLEYIHHVLKDGGMDWSDAVHMRVCFKHGGDHAAARSLLDEILEIIRATVPEPRPALNAFGVDLLYEGLGLEIDVIAKAGGKISVAPPGAGDWIGIDGFPVACAAGDELYIAGLSAPGAASLQAQVESTFDRLSQCIAVAGFAPDDLARATLFMTQGGDSAKDRATVAEQAHLYLLTESAPVLTVLTANGLPHLGQRFQLDAVVHRGTRRVLG